MKSKVEVEFYRYIATPEESTGQVQEGEESIPENPQDQQQPLTMTALDDGIHSGKVIKGEISLCKDEMRDLLDAEREGKSAVFLLRLVD